MENEVIITTDSKKVAEHVKKLSKMSLSEIDAYGSDIQQVMSNTSTNLLNKTNMVELGDAQDSLDKLSEVAKKQKKMLPILQTPLRKIKKLQGNFTKIQTKIDEISVSLESQKQKLDDHVSYMEEQVNNLGGVIEDLRVCEDSLSEYVNEVKDDDDQTRYQVVSNRLRMINGTRIIAEQAQAEALMIIGEQREAKAQLEQVIRNALPAIQIQAVNSVGIRVNKETQDIINKTREITGQIIVQNATDVRNMAVELQNNRTKSIVDDEKLMKAQDILNEALNTVMKAAEIEAETNNKMVRNLAEKAADNQRCIDMLTAKLSEEKDGDTTKLRKEIKKQAKASKRKSASSESDWA